MAGTLIVLVSAIADAAPFVGPIGVYNGQTYTSSPISLRNLWNGTGKPSGLYFAVAGPMNAEGNAAISITVGDSDRYAAVRASQHQGAAYAFTGIKINSNGELIADLRRFQSSGWDFNRNGGNSLNAANEAGGSAASGTIVQSDVRASTVTVTVTMSVANSSVGANATYVGDKWDAPTGNASPQKPRGNVYPNKDYQRYPYGVVVYWRGSGSYAYRGSSSPNNVNWPQEFRNPNSGKWNSPQTQSGQWAYSPPAGVYKTWGQAEGLNRNGNWLNIGKCDTDYYVPAQWANVFSSPDDFAPVVEGKRRTRRDVPATLTSGVGGITVGSSDPGEQTFAVLVSSNNRPKEYEVNYQGLVLSTDTSSWWSYGVANWANGYYYGWPVNNTISQEIDPDRSWSGLLAGATSVTARTAIKLIRSNGAYEAAMTPGSAYEIGSRATMEIMPLASGTVAWSDAEVTSFAQGQPALSKPTTITEESANLVVTASNLYPNSYMLGIVRGPDGRYKTVGSNFPSGAALVTMPLSPALSAGDSGLYDFYLMGYTPVDSENLGNAVVYAGPPVPDNNTSYVTLPGLQDGGATLPFGLAQAEELTVWNPPGQSQSFTYGWVQLARIQFRYEGKIEIKNTTIIQAN